MARSRDELTYEIVGGAIEVHRALGPGLLESSYRRCLLHELKLRGMAAESEVPVEIDYKDLVLPAAYRADIIVEGSVLVELKAVPELTELHQAQVLTYLRHTRLRIGLLMNFNVTSLRKGLRRFILGGSASPRNPAVPSLP